MPDKPEGDKSKEPAKSRREQLGDVDMPECDAGYLIGYLFEIGPTVSAGMSSGPISHSEIAAWQRNTGIELDAWQVRTLRALSIEYVNESSTANAPDSPAPWGGEPTAKDRTEVSNKVQTAFKLLMNTRPNA